MNTKTCLPITGSEQDRFLMSIGLKSLDPLQLWPFEILLYPEFTGPIADYISLFREDVAIHEDTPRRYDLECQKAVVGAVERRAYINRGIDGGYERIVAYIYPSLKHFRLKRDLIRIVFERSPLKKYHCERPLYSTEYQKEDFPTWDTMRLFDSARDGPYSRTKVSRIRLGAGSSNNTVSGQAQQPFRFYKFLLLVHHSSKASRRRIWWRKDSALFCDSVMQAITRATGARIKTYGLIEAEKPTVSQVILCALGLTARRAEILNEEFLSQHILEPFAKTCDEWESGVYLHLPSHLV